MSDNVPEKDKILEKINPWQKASVDLVELRFKVEDILGSFNEYEKNSARYDNLLESLEVIMTHALEEAGMTKYKNTKLKKTIYTLGIMAAGAFITQIIVWLFDILKGTIV